MSTPLLLKRVRWNLTGSAGPSIHVRLALLRLRYVVGVRLARHFCGGNRYGAHTPLYWVARPIGGQCLCSRIRDRLDYIPF